MPAHRTPLPRGAYSARDEQFETLLRNAANYQKTQKEALRKRSRGPKPVARSHKRRRAA